MSPAGRPPEIRADARANREALLDAAAELFAARGLDIPLEDVARAAGVGRATLYRRFPNREALTDGIIDRVIEELAAFAGGLPDTPDSFRRLFEEAIALQERNVSILESVRAGPRSPGAWQRMRGSVNDIFAAPLARAQEGGLVGPQVTPDDVRIVLMMVAGMMRPGTADADRKRARVMADRLLFG
jgi:AcrR family transcriptional regulator